MKNSSSKYYALLIFCFSFLESFGQYTFNLYNNDTVFLDQRRANIHINGTSFEGPILNNINNFRMDEIVIGLSSNSVGLIRFSGDIIKPITPICITSAKIYNVSQKATLRKCSRFTGYSISSIFENDNHSFEFIGAIRADTQHWFNPETFNIHQEKLELKRQKDIAQYQKIHLHDSLSEIVNYYGVYKVEILSRGGNKIDGLAEEGKIYFSENGVSIMNIFSLEPTIRCSIDKMSSIKPEKGTFVLNPNKSLYKSGVLVMGQDVGSITLGIGNKSTTTTFKILEFRQ